VDRKDIEAQPIHYMNNFGELIRDVPGVHVAQYYPWGPPWVHLRGTGYFIGRTVFLVDGIPVTPFQSQTINNLDIERVDVILRAQLGALRRQRIGWRRKHHHPVRA
jgi:iron complex outermembrane recepter protein